MQALFGVAIGFSVAVMISRYLAYMGAHGAAEDLERHADQATAAARQTREDIASMTLMLGLTNALLGGILGALIFH